MLQFSLLGAKGDLAPEGAGRPEGRSEETLIDLILSYSSGAGLNSCTANT